MLLHTPACILPSHLLRRLLFSSHTSLLVPSWWERGGTTVDDSLRIKGTDFFPRGFLRHADLVRRSAFVRLASPRAPFALRKGPGRPKRSNSMRTKSLNFVADVSWGWTERFCTPAAISADVSAMSYGGTHKQVHPHITGWCMWTASFGCLGE